VRIPFTRAQFFDVFSAYNSAVWPAQILLYVAGVIAVVLAFRRSLWGDRVIAAILAFYWIWMGVLYHLVFFRQINPAALIFGMLFVVQGLIFIITALRTKVQVGAPRSWRVLIGAAFTIYAVAIYPLLGIVAGHGFLDGPLFGVAPCPTTIFTFGILLMTSVAIPIYTFIVPFLWSLVGFSAALMLGVPEDYGLLVAGIIGTVLLLVHRRKTGRTTARAETHSKQAVPTGV
jgi:hypothetical protein